jgi:general secretion pathway protein D
MNRFVLSALSIPVLAGLLFAQDPVRLPQEEPPAVQLNNITLEQFAQSVAKRTKKTFIYSDQVGALMKQARVQLVAFRDFTDRDHLFSLFQGILSIQAGKLVLVPEGQDTYKILPEQEARRSGPLFVEELGPVSGAFVTKVFSLQYISAQEAFTGLVNLASMAGVVQFQGSQSIVVTDTDANVRRFEQIIKAIDVKKPDMIWKVVPLRQAVAGEVELMLKNLLMGIAAGGGQRGVRQPGLANIPGGAEQVTVVADRRTNSILILAEPGRIDQIRELVESLDKEPEFETSGTFVIPLRHRDAVDMSTLLNGLYRITVDPVTGMPPQGSGGSATATKPNQVIAPGATQPQMPASSGGGGSSQQLTGTEPTILPDKKTNSIVLVTDRNTYQMLSKVVLRLDRRRPQVLIKASVVEVTSNETFDLGTELARAVDPEGTTTAFARTNMGYSVLSVAGGVPSIVPIDTPGITLAVLKDRFGNIPLLFKALEDKAKISVIDEPEVATEDNGVANITLSNTVQIPVQTLTGTGISQTSFTPLVAETTLTITPHITEGGYLRLETEVKIEKFGATSAALPGQPPPVNSRLIKTPFQMAGGRTAVIGGIVTSDRTDSETSIPLLGDIPVFGFLFKRVRQVEVKRTLYVFITPYILYDEGFGDAAKLTQERLDRVLFDGTSGLTTEPPPEPPINSMFRYPDWRRRQD